MPSIAHREDRHRIELLVRPGHTVTDAGLAHLVGRLREVGATCFDPLPDYQVFRGTREELSDKVIAIAWRPDGRLAGFCSTILLPVPGVGEVLHLGLTCVRPADRRSGLTHCLTTRAVTGVLLRRPFRKLWITNVACVLSSLGNVALHFDEVYPSPFGTRPTATHRRIAETIARQYRDNIYIRPDAVFDAENFVFRGSVKDTVFEKSADESAFHHRMQKLNSYYGELLALENGDEAMQIGSVNLVTTLPAYWMRRHTDRRIRSGKLAGPAAAA